MHSVPKLDRGGGGWTELPLRISSGAAMRRCRAVARFQPARRPLFERAGGDNDLGAGVVGNGWCAGDDELNMPPSAGGEERQLLSHPTLDSRARRLAAASL